MGWIIYTIVKSRTFKIEYGISILAILIVIIFSSIRLSQEVIAVQQRQEKVTVIKDFMKDLEKIKILMPSEQPLTDCLKQADNNKVNHEQFEKNYEGCVSKNKYNGDNALALLDRNLSALKLTFNDSDFKSIMEDINIIRFSIYEMHNNRLALEGWLNDGCSRFISFIEKTQSDKLSTDETGKPHCALTVQSYEQFFQGVNTNKKDNISAIVDRKVSRDQFNYFIVPGSQNTIDNYFLKMNIEHYNRMISNINNLLEKFRSIINKLA